MKKLMISLAILMAGLIGVSIVNNVVMLKIHPLEFYYTPTGLMISIIVMSIESVILLPTVMWYVKKFLNTDNLEEGEKESN